MNARYICEPKTEPLCCLLPSSDTSERPTLFSPPHSFLSSGFKHFYSPSQATVTLLALGENLQFPAALSTFHHFLSPAVILVMFSHTECWDTPPFLWSHQEAPSSIIHSFLPRVLQCVELGTGRVLCVPLSSHPTTCVPHCLWLLQCLECNNAYVYTSDRTAKDYMTQLLRVLLSLHPNDFVFMSVS